MRKVYLEKNEANGEYITVNTYTAWQGFHMLGYHCIPFHKQQLDYLDLCKDDIVNGWIGSARKAFQILGVKEPEEVSIPQELTKYAGRKLWTSTLGEIRKIEDGSNIFIKPLEGHKLFTGHVRTGAFKDLMATAMCSDETKVLCSDVVNFITEYRGFVLNGKLIGLKHYNGDFKKIIDVSKVESAIKDYISAPVAYSIDFGLTIDNESLLVEVNDAFALGCYGLDSILYAKMIEARWDEIVGNECY